MTDEKESEEFDDENPILEEDEEAPSIKVEKKKEKITVEGYLEKTSDQMEEDIKVREKALSLQNEIVLNERQPCYPLNEDLANTKVFVRKLDISKIGDEWIDLGDVSTFKLLEDNSLLLFKFERKVTQTFSSSNMKFSDDVDIMPPKYKKRHKGRRRKNKSHPPKGTY